MMLGDYFENIDHFLWVFFDLNKTVSKNVDHCNVHMHFMEIELCMGLQHGFSFLRFVYYKNLLF